MIAETQPTCPGLESNRAIEQLEAQVQSRLGNRVRDLRLVSQEQGLILQGRAPTYYAKQLAQHAVMEASSLPIRANEMEVS